MAAEGAPTPPASHATQPAASSGLAGTILETMDSGGYTYVLLDDGSTQVWAAGPMTPVSVGDKVAISNPVPMPGFHSGTLDREFEMIYFASAITGMTAAAGAAGAPHGGAASRPAAVVLDTSDLGKVEGGQTVEEIFLGKDALVGKTVSVRGKVVKYSAAIMGKNWLHIQDGSGGEGTNDLTITTAATATVGDTVVISGLLVADKDFGFGYEYALIVEDAQVTVE